MLRQLSSQGLTCHQLADRRPVLTPGATQLLLDAAAALARYDTGPAFQLLEQQQRKEPESFLDVMDQAEEGRLEVLLEELGKKERQAADVDALYQHLLPEKGPKALQGPAGMRELAQLLLVRRLMLHSFVYALGPFLFPAGH
jgi:hypothetical protein